MSIARQFKASFNPAPKVPIGRETRTEQKQRSRREQAQAWAELCAYVSERDGYACRVCRKFRNPRAMTLLEKLHHHHVNYRSAGGMDTKDNVCCLCATCHDDVHLRATLRISGDAEVRDVVTGRLCGLVIERATESGWKVERAE